MNRNLLPLLLIAAFSLSCRAMQQQPRAAPSPNVHEPQTPRAVFRTFLGVVRAGDHARAWDMLSEASQAELGPSSGEFASRAFAGIKVRYGLWKESQVVLDHVVNPTLAMVAATGRKRSQNLDAVASALVREKGVWKLAVHGNVPVEPLSITPTDLVLRAPGVTIEKFWVNGRPISPNRQGDIYMVHLTPDQSPPAVVAVLARLPAGAPIGLAYLVNP